MLKAVFVKKNGRLCRCTIKGHAGYAEHGQDIVCASVSSAVQLTANLLTETFQEDAAASAKGDTVNIRTNGSELSEKLLNALLVHLQCISEEFPGTINFEFTEV
ncbi:MAG: ribosomal-processing cysteine protease Prp [Oscillospiraceae bacterium]|nr:ribosomal-processing cysteine protease Prp [Oscillospiraceae bacterium]MBQ7012957.1 ribosomal-processing cysteine protease Prp [Oscillospiraceae bacterium]